MNVESRLFRIQVSIYWLFTWASQREPKVKNGPRCFFLPLVTNRHLGPKTHDCVPSYCLCVCACLESRHRRTWFKKWWIYIKRRPWKEAQILWFLLRSSHIQMHTPFVVDPYWMFLSVLWRGGGTMLSCLCYARALKQSTKDNWDFIMSKFWRSQLDMPKKKPKFTQICVLFVLQNACPCKMSVWITKAFSSN